MVKKWKLMKLLNKTKVLKTIKKNKNKNKKIFFHIQYKQNEKIDFYCTKCLKITENSTNIQLKYDKVQINKHHSNRID